MAQFRWADHFPHVVEPEVLRETPVVPSIPVLFHILLSEIQKVLERENPQGDLLKDLDRKIIKPVSGSGLDAGRSKALLLKAHNGTEYVVNACRKEHVRLIYESGVGSTSTGGVVGASPSEGGMLAKMGLCPLLIEVFAVQPGPRGSPVASTVGGALNDPALRCTCTAHPPAGAAAGMASSSGLNTSVIAPSSSSSSSTTPLAAASNAPSLSFATLSSSSLSSVSAGNSTSSSSSSSSANSSLTFTVASGPRSRSSKVRVKFQSGSSPSHPEDAASDGGERDGTKESRAASPALASSVTNSSGPTAENNDEEPDSMGEDIEAVGVGQRDMEVDDTKDASKEKDTQKLAVGKGKGSKVVRRSGRSRPASPTVDETTGLELPSSSDDEAPATKDHDELNPNDHWADLEKYIASVKKAVARCYHAKMRELERQLDVLKARLAESESKRQAAEQRLKDEKDINLKLWEKVEQVNRVLDRMTKPLKKIEAK